MSAIDAVTVIVPCYNEGEQVDVVRRELIAALDGLAELEILFIDDGSTDDTLARIKSLAAEDPHVAYLSFTRNFGLEAAFTAGFRYARLPWCVQVDADLQAPPTEISALLAKAAEGYDVVFGTRPNRQDPWHRRFGSAAQHWIATRMLRIELPVGASTFRAVRTSLARTLADSPPGTPYLIAQIPLVGARYALVPTEHRQRANGPSRWRLARLAGASFELFFGYSRRPLNALYATAAAVALAGTVMLLAGTAPSVFTFVVSALNLAAIALIGRYLELALRESSRIRPFYIRESSMPVRPQDTLDAVAA